MKCIKQRTIKISDDTYKKLLAIKKQIGSPIIWIVNVCVNVYWKSVIGNRLNTKK